MQDLTPALEVGGVCAEEATVIGACTRAFVAAFPLVVRELS